MTDVPALQFAVEQAGVLEYAAAPTLELQLRIDAGNADVRSLLLNAQIRILDPRAVMTTPRPRDWKICLVISRLGRNLRALHWLERTLVVPTFTGSTMVPLRIPCGYDFEVSASKYLHAVRDGVIPLELLFSGSILFTFSDGALADRPSAVGIAKRASTCRPASGTSYMELYYRTSPGCGFAATSSIG